MPLTDEQAKQIKEQILKQVESFPEDKKAQIKSYVEPMNNQELEEFLIKNKMIRQEGQEGEMNGSESPSDGEVGRTESGGLGGTQCIMCALANKKVESLVIYEDKDYLAALEINPYTKGHTILIPKKHIVEAKTLKNKALSLANRIGKHLIKKLESEDYEITTTDDLKHAIINIIPKYPGEKLDYQRKPAKKEELKEIHEKIGVIKAKVSRPRQKREKTETIENSGKKEKPKKSLPQLNRRVP